MQDTHACKFCGSPVVERGYSLPLCRACRDRMACRSYPVWTAALAVIVLILMVVSFARFPAALAAGVAFERAHRAESAGNFARAAQQYAIVAARFPDSVEVTGRLGISQCKSGQVQQGISTISRLDGREVGRDLSEELEQLLNELKAARGQNLREEP